MSVIRRARVFLLVALLVVLNGCATLRAMSNAEDGAGAEAMAAWARWVDSGGDIAAATTWTRKVKNGVTITEVEEAFASVAAEDNIRAVGELSPSGDTAGSWLGSEKFLKIYSYCSPAVARAMVEFSPHMAAYLPCRITVLEKEDGLWIYTMNMDMLIKMGRKLPPDLKKSVLQVRNTIWKMMEKGAEGEF
ncbi:DUF302 domain-containing protein [Noviherbaspirillum cavernae]|uniref:DUF302 domain-containing protein n=2 Tax=Noviherbaspirillum cavernae TaxID=2320862 RepID=A0A418X614_9BURK|nr:DUF302 domain-containing protein [Noviherbaspirillum cavernae]